jgi:chaperone modulatory protein CbpM
MMSDFDDELLLDEESRISFVELRELSGLTEVELTELIEFGIFESCSGSGSEAWFSARCLRMARTASRLRSDFDLNLPGMALALTYLDRIAALEQRLRELECMLPSESGDHR